MSTLFSPDDPGPEAIAPRLDELPSLRDLFGDHYWDSFQGDKEVVMKHIDSVLALFQRQRTAAPLSVGWQSEDKIARIIDKHVRSVPDKNFIDRRWLVGVSDAAKEIASLTNGTRGTAAK